MDGGECSGLARVVSGGGECFKAGRLRFRCSSWEAKGFRGLVE